MSDLVGRMLLEAEGAHFTYYGTFTYGPDDPGAVTYTVRDVQLMMKRLREWYKKWAWKVHRYRNALIRFFRVAEKGERSTRRWHFHLMLWFEGPDPCIEWGSHNHKNELWPHWPHGWSHIVPVVKGEASQPAYYCASYALKKLETGELVSGGSSRPALGSKRLMEIARDHARAGLPLREEYTVAGAMITRGPRKGLHRRFRMRGRAMHNAFRAYNDEWDALRPGVDPPYNEWGLRNDPDAVFRAPPNQLPMVWHERSKRPVRVARGRRSGTLAVTDNFGRLAGILSVKRSGVATFAYSVIDRVVNVSENMRDVFPYASDEQHEKIEGWLADRRGPDWVPYEQYVAQRTAAIARTKEQLASRYDLLLADKTSPIYRKGLDVLRMKEFSLSSLRWGLRNLGIDPDRLSVEGVDPPFAPP